MNLADFPQIALVRIRRVVLQGFGPGELMIAGWSGADVSLASDLSCKSGHGTSDYGFPFSVESKRKDARNRPTLIDLAEDHHTGEPRVRIARDGGMEHVYP